MSEFKKSKNEVKSAGVNKRRLILKAGVPAILTMASKPSFGAVCNISGFASVAAGSVSGVARHEVVGCGGFSHGAWKKPDHGMGGGDGNRSHWYAAGIAPDPRGTANNAFATPPGVPIIADPNDPSEDPPATDFAQVFTHMSGDMRTFEDVVEANGSFDCFAAQTYLNALYFGWGSDSSKISPEDVILLHEAGVKGWTSFVDSNGNTINLIGVDIKMFFENTQH